MKKSLLLKISSPVTKIRDLFTKRHTSESAVFEAKEVRIQVPWGFVAGKWYGPTDERPILMLHGWQDNAGSFDTLIPLLPKHIPYLAIDLPGHGFSSRIPNGMGYSVLHYVQVIRMIQEYHSWNKVSLCSHSLGAQTSTLFASFFPNQCDLLICLDALLKPFQGSIQRHIKILNTLVDDVLKLDALNRENKEPPTYTYEEILNRWTTHTPLIPDEAKHLMKRGIQPSKIDPTRYYFSRDVRLKKFDFGGTYISGDVYLKLVQNITAPHLFIRPKEATYFEGRELYQNALNVLTASNPRFLKVEVNGGHHCHVSQPELVKDC